MKELNLFLITTKEYPWWHFWKREKRYTIVFNRLLGSDYPKNFSIGKWCFHYNIFDLVGYVDYNTNMVYYKEAE